MTLNCHVVVKTFVNIGGFFSSNLYQLTLIPCDNKRANIQTTPDVT